MTPLCPRWMLVTAVAAMLLAACGGDDPASPTTAATTDAPAEPATGTPPSDMGTEMGSEMATDMGTEMGTEMGSEMDMGGDFSWGEPADASAAGRVIEIEATDDLKWIPDELDIAPGETVTFRITNPGTVAHEFVLGDEETQAEMEQAMQEGTMHHDQPNVVNIPAGETVELTWTLNDQADGIIYGCHVAGHYAAGMKGTLTVG